MKWKQIVQHIPDGGVVSGMSAMLRQIKDGKTLGTYQTGKDGYLTVQQDGHTAPVFLHLQDAPGGDKVQRSDDTHLVAATCPAEWPAALRALGDGVVRGYAGELEATANDATMTYSVKPGAAVVYGHPVVIYTGLSNVPLVRPTSGTFIYRIVVRVYPTGSATTPGKAELGLIGPSTSNTPPALTQSPTKWEMSLCTVTVTFAGATDCTDDRNFPGEISTAVAGVVAPVSKTTSVSGVDVPGGAVTLVLPDATSYVITARARGEQIGAGAPQWYEVAHYNPVGFVDPLSIARSAWNGYIFVADYTNARIVMLRPDGSYYNSVGGYPHVRGIDVDANGYLHVGYFDTNYQGAAWAKLDQGTLGRYTQCYVGPGVPYAVAVTPAGDWAYVTTSDNRIQAINVAGAFRDAAVFVQGFGLPTGITYLGGYLYVVSNNFKGVYRYTTALTAQTQIISGLTNPFGVGSDESGNLLVCDAGAGLLRRYTPAGAVVDSIVATGPLDVATLPGNQLWYVEQATDQVRVLDETVTGYGALAIDIDGTTSPYLGIGNRNGSFGNVATLTKQGPASVAVKARMRADSGTFNLLNLALSAAAASQE